VKPLFRSCIRFQIKKIIERLLVNMKLVENLDADSFRQKLEEDMDKVLLDVRTPREHQRVRIPNSILIDISNPMFVQEIDKLDRRKSYFIYCRSGNRSFHAGNYMLKIGFEKVYNLQQGILSWNGEKEMAA
jgi:rhodanese-related sulfurtransferase